MIEKDVIIVGAGVSGMTAALYLLRAGRSVVIIEKEGIGGQIAKSPRVENFPSIKNISGLELANNIFDQITALGCDSEFDEIKSIEKIDDEIFIAKGLFNKYKGKALIIASGVEHRKIGVLHEDELVGKGVSYCATCDGSFFQNEDVIVIGDANTALQYTLLLSSICNKVYMNLKFDKFFGDKILVDQVLSKKNVIVEKELDLQEFLFNDDGVYGAIFKKTSTGELKKFDAKGIFICIGQIPKNTIFEDFVSLKNGFIEVNSNMETKTPGIFACGDCTYKKIRQVTTACNDGAIAAVNASIYLNNLEYKKAS